MKFPNRLPALVLTLLLVSCAPEGVLESFLEGENSGSPEEQYALNAQLVSNFVQIPGSTRIEGEPPAANDGISLDVSSSTRTAFLGEGFDITFRSDGEPVGAMIRFMSRNGELADEYFNVNLANNQSAAKHILTGLRKPASLNARGEQNTVNVDFGREIPPGEFCYEIRVFDNEQNISNPEVVCVTVENWGGEEGMSGTWTMVKEEKIVDGQTFVFPLGGEGCMPYDFSCADGSLLTSVDCYSRSFAEVEIREDGTYRARFVGQESWTDYGRSYDSCQLSTETERFDEISEGNWAYVEDSNRLTIVEYYYKRMANDVLDEEFNAPVGQARLVMDGTMQLTASSFVITDTRNDFGVVDGEVRKYYFERNP